MVGVQQHPAGDSAIREPAQIPLRRQMKRSHRTACARRHAVTAMLAIRANWDWPHLRVIDPACRPALTRTRRRHSFLLQIYRRRVNPCRAGRIFPRASQNGILEVAHARRGLPPTIGFHQFTPMQNRISRPGRAHRPVETDRPKRRRQVRNPFFQNRPLFFHRAAFGDSPRHN